MNENEAEVLLVKNCFLIAFNKIDDYLTKCGKKREFESLLIEIVKQISSDYRKNDQVSNVDRESIIVVLLATLSKVVDENQKLIKLLSSKNRPQESKMAYVDRNDPAIIHNDSSIINIDTICSSVNQSMKQSMNKKHGFLF